MSHIDKALSIWEGGARVDEPTADTPQSGRRSSLNLYPCERPSSTDEFAAAHSSGTGEIRSAEVDVPATAAYLSRLDHHPDLKARLVTGSASAVSLEQYRRLAAALYEAQTQRGLKTLMVTSALPDEGKTLTVLNLALTLTESYERRVLVIDADLRRPSVHTLLGVSNQRGLSDVLLAPGDELPLLEVSPRLSVVTAGRPDRAPLAALTSDGMRALLDDCGRRFDWVLLDTSPVGLLPDAQVLARLTGAVLLVIGAGSTPAATVQRAVADLGPECIVGTVLNRVAEHHIPEANFYDEYQASSGRG